MVKKQPANAGDTRDMGSIPGSGRSPGVGNGNPFQYSCLENTRGQRSLADYSARGCKEFDMTEVTQYTRTNRFINKHSLIMPYKQSIFDSFPINSPRSSVN